MTPALRPALLLALLLPWAGCQRSCTGRERQPPGPPPEKPAAERASLSTRQEQGLSLRWALDEREGTRVHDSSGHERTGVFSGGVVLGVPGVRGGCAFFKGSAGRHVEAASGVQLPAMAQGTLSLWFKAFDLYGGDSGLAHISRAGSPVLKLQLLREGRRLAFSVRDGTVHEGVSRGAVPPNTWTNAALTWDGATVKLFLDGALEAQIPSRWTLPAGGRGPVLAGDPGAGMAPFFGLLDEVTLLDRALAGERIAAARDEICAAHRCQVPVVVTLAGTGRRGMTDGDADRAMFSGLCGMWAHSDGVLYVTDSAGNNRVRTISRARVSTAASGFVGTNDVAVDSAGTLYVADQHQNTIMRYAAGVLSTFAGSGRQGFRDGPAAEAKFHWPRGLALDSRGRIYVADENNHRIRLVEGGRVSTLAGDGVRGFRDGPAAEARFAGPFGVRVDGEGAVHVADTGNHRIRLIRKGEVTTLAGSGVRGFEDGSVDMARFDEPEGLALGRGGYIYVSDQMNGRIRLVHDGRVWTLAGDGRPGFADGAALSARLHRPWGIAVDRNGLIYFSDYKNRRVRILSR